MQRSSPTVAASPYRAAAMRKLGVLQVQPTGRGVKGFGTVAHEGNSFAAGLDLKDIL